MFLVVGNKLPCRFSADQCEAWIFLINVRQLKARQRQATSGRDLAHVEGTPTERFAGDEELTLNSRRCENEDAQLRPIDVELECAALLHPVQQCVGFLPRSVGVNE